MKTRACCTFGGWRSDFSVHRGHYLDALNFLSEQLEFLFSFEDLETLRS